MRASLAGAIGLCAVALSGCETKRVWLTLPDFGGTEGLWLWRYSEETNSYRRLCRLNFDDVTTRHGQEVALYVQQCDPEHHPFELEASIERQNGSGRVVLSLWYVRWEDPGTYKISSYGPNGESALSETSIEL